MALIRIEPVKDSATGRFFLEIYYPSDADMPLVTTAPRYQTSAAAETDIMAMVAAAASTPRRTDTP